MTLCSFHDEAFHKKKWKHVHPKYHTQNTLLLYVWPSVFYSVVTTTCSSCRCLLSSYTVGRACIIFHVFNIAEFLSVLLLKQILSAFCQISRHVSAVISTPRSFSHICLVACVITQVVAGNQYRLIFWRGMTICVCLWRGEWPIKLNGASRNEVWDKVQPVSEAEMIGRHVLFFSLKLNDTSCCSCSQFYLETQFTPFKCPFKLSV